MTESRRMRCMKAGLVVTFLLTAVFLLASMMFIDSSLHGIPKLINSNIFIFVSARFATPLSPMNQSELCPLDTTVGPIAVNRQQLSFDTLNKKYSAFSPGGHFKPKNCTSHNKTAIIVAYRERENHLKVLLNNLIPFLIKQQTEFVIFVVEPVETLTFNRALLMNVGFVEALKVMNFTCFFFHDVDLIPVDERNYYRCSDQPRHMSVGNSKFHYRLPYPRYAGGVFGMSRTTYQAINGHSNLYFGWGGEDDDIVHRLIKRNYTIMRRSVKVGRYEALDHKRDKGNPTSREKGVLLKWKNTNETEPEGLDTLKYTIVKKEEGPLFTWILVDVDMKYYQKAIDKIKNMAKEKKKLFLLKKQQAKAGKKQL